MSIAHQIDRALVQLSNLIEKLRACMGRDASSESELNPDFVHFQRGRLGGLALSGDEIQLYRACVEGIASVHEQIPEEPLLSRRAAASLVEVTTLRALNLRRVGADGRIERTPAFVRRLGRELANLRKTLMAPPTDWTLTVPVGGFALTGLPFRMGRVEFDQGTPQAARELAKCVPGVRRGPRMSAKRAAAEHKARSDHRMRIVSDFTGAVIATVRVRALDEEAATSLGVLRIREAIDVINFFAPYFHKIPSKHRAFVAPEGERVGMPYLLRPVEGDRSLWGHWSSDSPPVAMISPSSPRAAEIGLERANEILERERLSDLDRRVINAMRWAGRASVEARREQAFLLFAIALEALLANARARGGMTDRLRLRAAHLIGLRPDTRKQVADWITDLFRIRGEIVHAGTSTELAESDLKLLRNLVQHALTSFLKSVRFEGMTTAAEFERWLDDQALAGGQ